ncbi:SHOCT domain-containing protein [Halonotius roseus]|uniref:SHOCT domain-containing protein n=1 Tax=Halonotius roseus TaxID=2511997 RepID=A0A544QKS9_9EURY|nr:SHOCT domain-containing protein [Halonotius roseus]TQQ78970.1 SHOCT domain-containing protein [Halonotius roseus]
MSESDTAGDTEESPLEQIAAGVTMALIFLVAFGLLALDFAWFWVVFPVGFGGVLPAVIGLVRYYEQAAERDERDAADDTDDPLETLKRQYACGEIDEAEFERRLDGLLGSDSAAETAVDEPTPEPADRETARE